MPRLALLEAEGPGDRVVGAFEHAGHVGDSLSGQQKAGEERPELGVAACMTFTRTSSGQALFCLLSATASLFTFRQGFLRCRSGWSAS